MADAFYPKCSHHLEMDVVARKTGDDKHKAEMTDPWRESMWMFRTSILSTKGA